MRVFEAHQNNLCMVQLPQCDGFGIITEACATNDADICSLPQAAERRKGASRSFSCLDFPVAGSPAANGICLSIMDRSIGQAQKAGGVCPCLPRRA